MQTISEKTGIRLNLFQAVGAVIFLLGAGGTLDRVLNTSKAVDALDAKIENLENLLREQDEKTLEKAVEWTNIEVGGLRSDWERDRASQEKEHDEINAKL